MAVIRFGINGCGGISHLHAECLKTLADEGIAKLVAGAEPDAGRREAWAKKWNVPVYATLAEMLATAGLDAVTVTSPSGLHAEHVTQIAAAGRHVLCEKPLDLHLNKADAAIAACEAAGVTLGAVFQQRFVPGPQKARRVIDQGLLGRIVFAHAETPWYRTQGYYDSDKTWRGTWALDGGVLANQSPHMIDRLLWLGGDLEEVLHAELRCGLERDIEAETVAAVTVRLAGGVVATITGTTLAYDGLPQRVLICGTEGSLAFSGDDLVYLKTKRPFEDATPAPTATVAAAGGGAADPLAISGQGHLANIRDFATALRDKRPPTTTGHDSRKVTRALDLIYRKAGIPAFQSA